MAYCESLGCPDRVRQCTEGLYLGQQSIKIGVYSLNKQTTPTCLHSPTTHEPDSAALGEGHINSGCVGVEYI